MGSVAREAEQKEMATSDVDAGLATPVLDASHKLKVNEKVSGVGVDLKMSPSVNALVDDVGKKTRPEEILSPCRNGLQTADG